MGCGSSRHDTGTGKALTPLGATTNDAGSEQDAPDATRVEETKELAVNDKRLHLAQRVSYALSRLSEI